MPTIPLPELEEPNPHAEQARAIVRAATRSVGATDRVPFRAVVSLMIVGVVAALNPNPALVLLAIVAVIVLALTLVERAVQR